MSEQFHAEAAKKAEQLAATLATDQEEVVESEDEVVISRDPATGKLVGTRQKAN
jgi:hypothetical protein